MNTDWIDFLKSNGATLTECLEVQFPDTPQRLNNSVTALTHLALIKVTGKDAAHFLQGQLTCDINELTESNSFFSAFCNAKGRVISSLLIIKQADDFLMILPTELVEKVINKLKMYVLRAKVQLTDVSHDYALMGLNSELELVTSTLPKTNFEVSQTSEIIIKLPVKPHRYLIITPISQAASQWQQWTTEQGHIAINANHWLYQDISAGIPWLTSTSSEQFIPQMLNIDKLGGISFNKGCYTGQEIIARTHFLGKTKRELCLVECSTEVSLDENSQLITGEDEQIIGQILLSQYYNKRNRMLVVMPLAETPFKNLKLKQSNQAKISIINFK